MRRAFRAAAGVAALVLAPEVARADDGPPAPPPLREEHWYGYQTLLADGAAIATLTTGVVLTVSEVAGGGNDANPILGVALTGVGGTSYLFAAPIVHWAHGRVGVGFLSLGLRMLAPVAGLGLGALGSELANGSKNQIGIPIGALLGALVPVVLDATVLGWERTSPGVGATEPRTPAVLPTLGLSKQGVALGMTWRL